MWAVTEESVLSLQPNRVEALDGNGVVLRATQLGDDDDDEAAETPKVETELTTLARLLAEAHDAGARRHAEAYALAFRENTQLVQILASRLSGLENAWQKAMQQTAQAHADAVLASAQQQEDPAGAAIAGMMAQMALASAAKPAPTPAPNGKANGQKGTK
jgi:hypothetical protein